MNKVNLCLWSLTLCLAQLTNTATAATKITQFGITWTFDKDYTTGTFANGDYWVVGPVDIISIEPNSTRAPDNCNTDCVTDNPAYAFTIYPYPLVTSTSLWTIQNNYGTIEATIPTTQTNGMEANGKMRLLVSGTNNSTVNGRVFRVTRVVTNSNFTIILHDSADGTLGTLDDWGNHDTTVGGTFGGRIINGSMINPPAQVSHSTTLSHNNGWDSFLGDYYASLNVATGVSPSSPLTVPVSSSLVSTIYNPSPHARKLKVAAVLTVLAKAPPANSFRPAYAGTDKTIRYNLSTVEARISLLPNLAVPAGATAPSLTETTGDTFTGFSMERLFERPWLWHGVGFTGEFYSPLDSCPGYGRDTSTYYAKGPLSLCLNYTTEQKLSLLRKVVQVGIDRYRYVEDDANVAWWPDGGQGIGNKFPILFSGYMLNDAGMLAIGSIPTARFYFAEDATTFYVDAANIGTTVGGHIYGFDDSQSADANVYTSAQVGMPEWGIQHLTTRFGGTNQFQNDRVRWGANYRGVVGYSLPGMILTANILGLKSAWNHDALFDYVDRYMSVTAPGGEHPVNRSLDPFAEKMWDAYRANYGSIWTTPGSGNSPPHADAGSDQDCNDSDRNGSEQVTLDGSGSIGNIADADYVWTNEADKKTIAIGKKPLPVTLPIGRHIIRLTVTDKSGHKSNDTLTVIVRPGDGSAKYFKFDEGSGLTASNFFQICDPGYLINGPAWTAQGEISFDGNDDAVEITNAYVNVNKGTIALWAYPDAFSKNKHSLFGHDVLSQNNKIQLYCNAAGSLNVGLGNNAASSTNIQNLNPHEWYHIALVWDQGNYRLYVDGVTRVVGTYTGLSSLATYAYIGNSESLTEGFDGLIDEVRLYNRPLDVNEIKELALVFLPIGDKTTAEGEELCFTVRTKSGSITEISDINLPSTPYFASNLFRWTPGYNDAGVYEVEFTALHGEFNDFEIVTISVTNTLLPDTAPSSSWDNGSGDIYYNFNGNLYIWDLSGSYFYKAGEWQLDYTLIQDARGKITGTGTASNSAVNSGAAVPITLKGAISGAAAVKMTLKGTSVKGRIKGTVNGGSKAISGTAKINRQSASFTAPLPANMDGSATLSLSCTSSGNSRFGMGEQTLSNGESYNFGIKGKYNAKSDESTLTLKGSTKGSSLKMKVDGSDGTIKILKGKVLGQKLNATNIVP